MPFSLSYSLPGALQHPLQTDVSFASCQPAPSDLTWASILSFAGDVHIAIMDRSGQLEVEVIEARGLTPKPGSKSLPGESEQLGDMRKDSGRDGVLASPRLTGSLKQWEAGEP